MSQSASPTAAAPDGGRSSGWGAYTSNGPSSRPYRAGVCRRRPKWRPRSARGRRAGHAALRASSRTRSLSGIVLRTVRAGSIQLRRSSGRRATAEALRRAADPLATPPLRCLCCAFLLTIGDAGTREAVRRILGRTGLQRGLGG